MLKLTQPKMDRVDPAEERQRARAATMNTTFKFVLLVALIRFTPYVIQQLQN